MKEVTIYMLETLVCSGVLLAVYAVLLEGRIKFRWCRMYLLTATLGGALIPLLRIPIWPGKIIEATPIITTDIPAAWSAEVLPDAEPVVTAANIWLGLYLLGAALIMGVMAWQIIRMAMLRRTAKITRTKTYTLARTLPEIASFSFLRTIYVWDKTPAEEMAAIIAHESSHIAHRHSIERVVMELMKAALWWNPFAWIMARRLTETEEFEADSDVLNSGYDRSTYMQIIFKQLFGYSPEIANGLRSSLTKKRFKMMTKQTNSRHNLLRLAATLPAFAGLLCAFSFTSRAAIVVTPASDAGIELIAEQHTTDIPQADGAQAEAAQPAGQTKVSITTLKDGAPLSGSIITLQGAADKGALTNNSGYAELYVPVNSVLEITHAGCSPKIVSVGEATAYTFSVSLAENASGESHASWQPLNIVDGVEISSINDINPNRIESFTVLKIDSAVALFGERGRHGALVVKLYTDEEIASGASKVKKSDVAPATPERNGLIVHAQNAAADNSQDDDDMPFLIADTMPQFPIQDGDEGTFGNLTEFRKWVQKTVKYPAVSYNNNIQGRVVLSFVIERDGSVGQISVLQSPDEALANEARRVIASSPRWKPGVQLGNVVRVKYTLPIDFKMSSPAAEQGPAGGDEPFLVTEVMPKFDDGGLNEFRKWVQMNLKYPPEAISQKIYGKVSVSFVVEKDGSVGEIKVLQSPHETLSKEVRRVVASSPRWTAGTQRGEKVRVKFTLPVDFAVATGEGTLKDETAKKTAGSMDEISVIGYGS